MKKLLFVIGAVVILNACVKAPDPAFCWTCSQYIIINSTDTTPTIQRFDTTRLCELTQNEIDQHEASNGVQMYSTHSKDAMRCVRDEQ